MLGVTHGSDEGAATPRPDAVEGGTEPMTTPTMTLDCDGFADALADYLEGDAPDAVRAAVECARRHVRGVRQLLADLDAIRHDAAALPALSPSRDLWAASPSASMRRSSRWAHASTHDRACGARGCGPPSPRRRSSCSRPVSRTSHAGRSPSSASTAQPSRSRTATLSRRSATAPVRGPTCTTTDGTGESTASASAEHARCAARPTSAARRGSLASAEPLMRTTEPVYDREIVKLRHIVKSGATSSTRRRSRCSSRASP